jgi:hypothetical protein
MNISLLSKWLWKLVNEKGDWKTLLNCNYLKNVTIGQADAKPGDSHLWQGLMDVKRLFWPCTRIKVGDGRRCRFWEDVWLCENSLANTFPRLYSISLDQHITVHRVFTAGISYLRFRRDIVGEKLVH